MLALFSAGGSVLGGEDQTTGSIAAASVVQLAVITAGNLGSATPLCSSAFESQSSVTLTCPAGALIGTIEAAYGAPTGSCTCPPAQLPVLPGKCPGTSSNDGVTCDVPGSYCFSAAARPMRTPSGDRIPGGACCAASLVNGRPDFSSLDVRRDPYECAADVATVSAIVSGLCLGQSNCTLLTSRSASQTWVPSARYGTTCTGTSSGGGAVSPIGTRCAASWSGGGGLATCNSSVNFSPADGMRLVVIARCYAPVAAVSWFNGNWFVGGTGGESREVVALLVMALDLVIALIFLAAACWLQAAEAAGARPRLTASDYTISLSAPSLPPHDDLKSLESILRIHFERVLDAGDGAVHVADINFGLQHDALLTLFTRRGDLLQRLERQGRMSLRIEAERRRVLLTSVQSQRDAGDTEMVDNDAAMQVQASQLTGAGYALPPRAVAPRSNSSSTMQSAYTQRRLRATLAALDAQLVRQAQFVDRLVTQLQQLDAEIDMIEARPGMSSVQEGKEFADSHDANVRRVAAAAFITFEERSAVTRARLLYPDSRLRWLCQPRALRFDGTVRVWLEAPAEPTDIRWENFAMSPSRRTLHRWLSCVVIVGSLVACA